MDPELLGLACSHPNVHVVTRNSHTKDIVQFLADNGVPAAVQVHHVGKGRAWQMLPATASTHPPPPPLFLVLLLLLLLNPTA
jgi:hypothetical protein